MGRMEFFQQPELDHANCTIVEYHPYQQDSEFAARTGAKAINLNELPFSGSLLHRTERELRVRRYEISAG